MTLTLELIDKGINTKERGVGFVKNFSQNIETQFGYLGAMIKFPATSLLSIIFP